MSPAGSHLGTGDDLHVVPASPSGVVARAAALRAERTPGVVVTVARVRGHAPRAAGAKMLVTPGTVYGTIGGGNLEMAARTRAIDMLAAGTHDTDMVEMRLNDKAPAQYGRQCCGGEVTLLFEPQPVPPAVAIFGTGHVGLELARILSRHELDLYCTDSRPEALVGLDVLEPGPALVHREHSMIPEEVMDRLPAGTHVLIMTHDHAEDHHLCDAALRRPDLGSVGLIGSRTKWQRFRRRLLEAGHAAEAVDAIDCPIGLPGITGKEPAVIAVGVAAALLTRFGSSDPTVGTSDTSGIDTDPATHSSGENHAALSRTGVRHP